MSQKLPLPTVVAITVLISVTAFTVDCSVPVLPMVAEALNTSERLTQMVVGLFILGYGCGQIPCGLLLDRFGRRPVLLGGIALFIVFGFMASIANDITSLLIARFFQGFVGAIGPVGSRALIRDLANEQEMPRLMSTSITALSVATMVAPLIGSILASLSGWRAPFWSSFALGVLAIILVWFFVPVVHGDTRKGTSPLQQVRESLSVFLASHQSVWSTAMLAIFFAGYLSIVGAGSTVMVSYYGLSNLTVGYLYTLSAGVYVFGSFINRWIIKRRSPLQALGVGVAALSISTFGFLFISLLDNTPLPVFWGLVCIYLFVLGFVLPNTTTISLAPITRAKGFVASITGSAQILGGAIGAMSAAQLYSGTYHAITTILSVTGIIGITLYMARHRLVKAFVM